MSELKACSKYDSKNHQCLAGFVRTYPLCRGVYGCDRCGSITDREAPYCMRDDLGVHLITDDGKPLLLKLRERGL